MELPEELRATEPTPSPLVCHELPKYPPLTPRRTAQFMAKRSPLVKCHFKDCPEPSPDEEELMVCGRPMCECVFHASCLGRWLAERCFKTEIAYCAECCSEIVSETERLQGIFSDTAKDGLSARTSSWVAAATAASNGDNPTSPVRPDAVAVPGSPEAQKAQTPAVDAPVSIEIGDRQALSSSSTDVDADAAAVKVAKLKAQRSMVAKLTRTKSYRAARIRNCVSGKTRKQVPELPEYVAEDSVIATVLSWRGTILPLALTSPSFWLQVGFHGLFVGLSEYYDMPETSTALITTMISLSTFFLVFYGSQCYTRYFTMYSHCVGIGGSVMCWVALVKMHGNGEPNTQWNAIRYMIAAAHIEYYLLSGGELTEDEWLVIQGRQLLSPKECAAVRAFAGFKPFLPIYWGMAEARQTLMTEAGVFAVLDRLRRSSSGSGNALAKGRGEIFVAHEWDQFQQAAFALRSHCSQIVNLLKQPVPWAYFHLLSLMIFVTLFMIGYVLVGMAEWPITLFVHFIVCLIFVGMKNLAVSMADPFGEDIIDFKIERYLASMHRHAVAHLNDNFKPNGATLPSGITNPIIEQFQSGPRV